MRKFSPSHPGLTVWPPPGSSLFGPGTARHLTIWCFIQSLKTPGEKTKPSPMCLLINISPANSTILDVGVANVY